MDRYLVNPKKMAEILNVPVSWLYQRTRLGQDAIPHIKLGKYIRFYPEEVVEFFRNQRKIMTTE